MRASDNGHYLVDNTGQPFFYLADTAWYLLYKLDREETLEYLRNRADKGFTVIMLMLIAETEGLGLDKVENRYGAGPIIDCDPTRPNEAFWQHVDYVVSAARDLGIRCALLPSWGEFVGPISGGRGPIIFNTDNARIYGEFLGQRYKDDEVFWVLGGDRNPEEEYLPVWRSMAEGLRKGDGGRNLMTFHPWAVYSSSEWLHNEPWLDFNMHQTSTGWDRSNYEYILRDYNKQPFKPVVDGETRYERSHEFFWKKPPYGRQITPHQVRKAAYNSLLSGAMGHTYGCRDIHSFYVPGPEKPRKDMSIHWRTAMDLPGAYQMTIVKSLFTKYPWYRLLPDSPNRLLVHGQGEGGTYIPAAMCGDGDFALIYIPESMPIWVDTTLLKGESVQASWFNPQTGEYSEPNIVEKGNMVEFRPHKPEVSPDWILILEGIE